MYHDAGHTACCKLLLDEGADIEQRNVVCNLLYSSSNSTVCLVNTHVVFVVQMGESPLIRAAHNGHMQTVKFLVEQGANVNALDMGDNSALHWAAMRGHVEIVKFLTEQGADKTLRNKQEKLPIDLCQSCWSDAYRFTRQVLA